MISFLLTINLLTMSPDTFLNLINQSRVEQKLSPLKFNDTLSKAAQARANDIITKNYWSHTSPEGKKAYNFMVDNGYQYNAAGENLARGSNDPNVLYKMWMDSPTHRSNILNSQYKETGIAIVPGLQNGAQTYYVIQLFGDPQVKPKAFTPKPVAKTSKPVATPKPSVKLVPQPTKSLPLTKPSPRKRILGDRWYA